MRRCKSVKQHPQNDSEAIGEHVPGREDAAEQQRARYCQPKGVEPGGVNKPEQLDPTAIEAEITAMRNRD